MVRAWWIAALIGWAACLSAFAEGKGQPSLSGEWLIVEVDSVPVEAFHSENVAYIGFDDQTHRVWGCSGCNRLLGSYTADASTGQLDLSGMGSTKMLCADMQLEDAVMRALARVARYEALEDGRIGLYDNEGRRAMTLKDKR